VKISRFYSSLQGTDLYLSEPNHQSIVVKIKGSFDQIKPHQNPLQLQQIKDVIGKSKSYHQRLLHQ